MGGNLQGSFAPCLVSSPSQFPEFLTGLACISVIGKPAHCGGFNSCVMFAWKLFSFVYRWSCDIQPQNDHLINNEMLFGELSASWNNCHVSLICPEITEYYRSREFPASFRKPFQNHTDVLCLRWLAPLTESYIADELALICCFQSLGLTFFITG